jgi:hypothetical protein
MMRFSELQLMCLESYLIQSHKHWSEKILLIRNYIFYYLIDIDTGENVNV